MCERVKGTTAPCDLILVIFAEGASENRPGKQAIGSVVRNRVTDTSHEFQGLGGYEAVIHQAGQFESVGGQLWTKGEAHLNGTATLTGRNADAFHEAVDVAEGVYTGSLRDNTKGSLFFATPNAFGGAVRTCLQSGRCEKVDVEGDRNQHEFVRYKPK